MLFSVSSPSIACDAFTSFSVNPGKPNSYKIDVLAFENCRISTNNKTAISGLPFYLLCLDAIAHK